MKNWLVIVCLVALTAVGFSQNIVTVYPGEGTLTQALTDAQDGDILELVPEGEYTESTGYIFGTIVDKNITIDVEGGDAAIAKAILKIQTPPDGESTIRFFEVGDNASLTLRNLEIDGSFGSAPSADYLITFYMGETPNEATINKIRVENCYIHDFVSDVIAAGGSDMRGNVIVDSTFVDNVIMENTGTSIYYKYCGANFISLTNSTFNTINSYGFRVAGPVESNFPLNTPSVVIDRTTWYNIGTEDGREVILCEKGPHLGQWQVSNSICVQQINKDKVVINIKETVTPEQAVINNICLWDVGARNWRDHPVSDTLAIDPEFADPENGDFTLPAGSALLTYASDGGAIGDPRWATNATAIEDDNAAAYPQSMALKQNYPNPFNPETSIQFSLAQDGQTILNVYNLLGHRVAQLVDGRLSAGEHKVTFEAKELPSGIYFYRLETPNGVMTKKMTLLE